MRLATLPVPPSTWSLPSPSSPSILLHRLPPPLSVKASSSSSSQEEKSEAYKVPSPKAEWAAEWVPQNDEAVRQIPIWVGSISLLAVLVNRAVSGIAPVSNASRSLVVVYDDTCLLQVGIAASSSSQSADAIVVDPVQLLKGSLCQGVMKSGTQSFLANLSLYPGKSDMPFLPSNTQAVILQPLGERGVAIIGGDTIRGFTRIDQAWITLISEKLESSLLNYRDSRAAVNEDYVT